MTYDTKTITLRAPISILNSPFIGARIAPRAPPQAPPPRFDPVLNRREYRADLIREMMLRHRVPEEYQNDPLSWVFAQEIRRVTEQLDEMLNVQQVNDPGLLALRAGMRSRVFQWALQEVARGPAVPAAPRAPENAPDAPNAPN